MCPAAGSAREARVKGQITCGKDYNETKTYSKKCYMRILHARMTRNVLHPRADFDIDNDL